MEVAEKYGPIGKMWLGPYLFIIISDLDAVEYLMKHSLARGSLFKFLEPAFGNGILTAPSM
jgi:hypothetical protein